MKIAFRSQASAQWAVSLLLLLLVILTAGKPRVETGFHTDYLANLSAMQALTGKFRRDLLLVRQGLLEGHDLLESDLESMERLASEAAFVPVFTDSDFRKQSEVLLADYFSRIAGLREQVENSKRSIELLNEAKVAFRVHLEELNDQLAAEGPSVANSLLMELNFALVYQPLDFRWLETLLQLQLLAPGTASVAHPLILHTRMILAQQQALNVSSKELQATLDQLQQPKLIKAAYLDQYHASISLADTLQWARSGVVAALLLLCGALVMVSRRAAQDSASSTRMAQQAQAESERQVRETQQAIRKCNEVLAQIASGDFRHRVDGPFDEELERLRTGINETAESVEYTMLELTRVMLAIQEGRFEVRLDSQVQGNFGRQVDQTIATLDTTIGNICRVMDDMRGGCFSTRVEAECHGRLQELKQAINNSMMSMEEAITRVVEVAEHQSNGDFSRRIRVSGQGQLEQLALSINSTSARIHETVQHISQVSGTVAYCADSLQGNSIQLWEHTSSHSDAITRLLQKVDTVRKSIQSNRDSVETASSLVENSSKAANEGTSIANEAIGFMEDINQKSLKIATITQVLDNIAKQTNLLALNAAVEAARSQQHGSGFSVVANEVKELARQSAEASKHITALIQATADDIRLGAESVTNTGQALLVIGQSISDVERATQTIVEELRQQEKGMDTIVEIVSESREVMNSDLLLAHTTREASEYMGELAHDVTELLSFFNTEEIAADEAALAETEAGLHDGSLDGITDEAA